MNEHNGHDPEDDFLDDPETFEDVDFGDEEEEGAEGSADSMILKLEDELAQTKDRMMRLAADLENTRRRAQKEKNEALQYGIGGFARDLLSVADNFQRAIETAPQDPDTVTPDMLASLLNGVKMTEKELLKVLERHGVVRIYPKGEKFDPHLHQAIAEVPGTGEPQGHVVDVAQPGFTIGERVLRAAMVTVSNGAGAKTE